MEEKKILRKKFRESRNSIGEKRRDYENKIITSRLFKMEEYKKAQTIFIYVSIGSEVDTKEIIKKALTDGKTIAVPLCDAEKHTMSAVRIDRLSALKKGTYGIREPNTDLPCERISADKIDLTIAPALCYDIKGNRLGYGGGYYDRFLKDFKGTTVGLAYSDCIVDSLPTEETDCRVDIVLMAEKGK